MMKAEIATRNDQIAKPHTDAASDWRGHAGLYWRPRLAWQSTALVCELDLKIVPGMRLLLYTEPPDRAPGCFEGFFRMGREPLEDNCGLQ